MRALELKDICGYLPHELKIICTDKTRHGVLDYYGRIYTLTPILVGGTLRDAYSLPILRPLSDLYKTITHKGKEIIPIVECAKMATGKEDFRFGNMVNGDKYLYRHREDFSYCKEKGLFTYREEVENLDRNYMSTININQWQLFDFLHELKIDYRGLIDAGLAFDCNTLKSNPYK